MAANPTTEPVVDNPNPAAEPPKAETPPKGTTNRHVVDGEVLDLTPEEEARAVAIAVRTIKAQTAAAEKKTESETKNLTKEQQLEKQLEDLRNEVHAFKSGSENSNTINRVEAAMKDVPDDLREVLTQNTLAMIALAKSRGTNVTPEQVAAAVIEKNQTAITKLKPTVDANQKIKDAQQTRLGIPGGRTAGQDAPKTFNRHSFRDGSLTKSVAGLFKELSNKATE